MSFFPSGATPVRLAKGRQSLLSGLFGIVLAFASLQGAAAHASAPDGVRLDGHVLPALAASEAVSSKSAGSNAEGEELSLTVVLRRADETGFQRYLADVYNPKSAQFRQFLTPREVSDRFGPTQEDMAAVRGYFAQAGFRVEDESTNRMTLTLAASRVLAEQVLDVRIADYRIADREFHANDRDPVLPAPIASRVQGITGLSNLALPTPPAPLNSGISTAAQCYKDSSTIQGAGNSILCGLAYVFLAIVNDLFCLDPITYFQGCRMISPIPPGAARSASAQGSTQKIGIVAFDSFHASDVSDFLALVDAPASRIDQLSLVNVGGGATVGANASEVLLDIDTLMMIAPQASYVVYSAPFTGNTSFQALFNRMIDDDVTIISNSWAYCEDQTTLADVQSIDAILATAAASGISVFNASGDSGSTCLDGSPNTITVPAGSPHGTAVGGTSVQPGPGGMYGSETWWNGDLTMPVTGKGGFGVSRFFARPSYQDGFTASPMRSIPDLSLNADPVANGVPICQASMGGCPSGLLYGGTSIAAPMMAAFTALLNDAHGSNIGWINPQVYPFAATPAFHPPSAMGTDFAHVGLGSPNVGVLYLALENAVAGPPSAAMSIVVAVESVVVADAATPAIVLVQLRDANGSAVSGKTVQLTASAGSSALITPASAVTSVSNGAAAFTVTDTTIEDVVFTARSLTDNLTIDDTATVSFVAPSAASASIFAFPTSVPADGISTTSITITLRDAENQPTPGKRVTLSQNGRSVVTGPDPPVTDSNGEIVFTAADGIEETVTYTAVDNSDGDLPIPGSAVVTFSGSAAGSCAGQATPAGPDYSVTSFINGFVAAPFLYGNVNWGCRGAGTPAFGANGDVFVAHFPTGDLYRLGPDGGAAAAPISNLGPALDNLVFGLDGRLYATHGATTGDFHTGDVIEIDPGTGALLRVVVSPVTCPNGLAVDPLSGDLFFTDPCFGAGSDNPALTRVTDPADTDPGRPTAAVEYALLPSTPNGVVSFASDGTIYVGTAYGSTPSPVYSVTGTDQPAPPIVAAVPDVNSFYWVNVANMQPSGAAHSLFALGLAPTPPHAQLNLIDITVDPVTITPIALDIGCSTIGPDGCLYSSTPDTVYKIAPTVGACSFTGTSRSPSLALTPETVSPNPDQGSTQTLMAVLRNVELPAGIPVRFRIEGANEQTLMARADAQGIATLEYRGVFSGSDVITASAQIDAMTLVSNSARATWDAGAHASFLGITGPVGAVSGEPVLLFASLVDAAEDPQVAIVGAAVHFAVGNQSCDGTTGANSIASCSVTLTNPGAYTLTVSYAGSAQHLPTASSAVFVIPSDNVDLIFADGFEGN